MGSDRPAPDATACQAEDFACGDLLCASQGEACQTTVADRSVAHACVPAAGTGCEATGIVDCGCLAPGGAFPEGTTCERDGRGEIQLHVQE